MRRKTKDPSISEELASVYKSIIEHLEGLSDISRALLSPDATDIKLSKEYIAIDKRTFVHPDLIELIKPLDKLVLNCLQMRKVTEDEVRFCSCKVMIEINEEVFHVRCGHAMHKDCFLSWCRH